MYSLVEPREAPHSSSSYASSSSSSAPRLRTPTKILSLGAFQEIENLRIEENCIQADSEFVVIVVNDVRSKPRQLQIYGLKNNSVFVYNGVEEKKYVRGNQFTFQPDGAIWETVAPRRAFSKPTRTFDLRNYSLELRSIVLSGKTSLTFCHRKHINREVCPFLIKLSHNAEMSTSIASKMVACDISENATLDCARYPMRDGDKLEYWLLESLTLKCTGRAKVKGISVEALLTIIGVQMALRDVKVNIIVSGTCQFLQKPRTCTLPREFVITTLVRPISRPVATQGSVIQRYRSMIEENYSPAASFYAPPPADDFEVIRDLSFQEAQQTYHGPVSDLGESFELSEKDKKGKKPNFKIDGKLDTEDIEKKNVDDPECVICGINVAKVYITCGHTPLCVGCAKRMQYEKVGKVCPVCRAKITQAIIPIVSTDKSSKSELSFEITGDISTQDTASLPEEKPETRCQKCTVNQRRVVFSCGCKIYCLQCSQGLQREISRCRGCKLQITSGIALKH